MAQIALSHQTADNNSEASRGGDFHPWDISSSSWKNALPFRLSAARSILEYTHADLEADLIDGNAHSFGPINCSGLYSSV